MSRPRDARWPLTASLLLAFLALQAPVRAVAGPGDTKKQSAAALEEAEKLAQTVEVSYRMGNYDTAIPLAERAVLLREQALGPDHPDLARTLSSLAVLYYATGDYTRAEPPYLRALAIREKAFGPDHPAVAVSLNSLASLYRSKGDYKKAGELYARSLDIDEKAFGPDHPDVSTDLNNLASLTRITGDYAQAEKLYLRALAIREKAFGADHPLVVTTLNNLAAVYSANGDYTKAEPLYQRALTVREKSLGPNHPDVATALNGLAMLYQAKGDYARAEPLYQRALAIREKALGQDHPDVAITLHDLAVLYHIKGDYVRAEPLCQRALAIREEALGQDHPDVAISLRDLAGLYWAKGEYARAELLYRQALAIQEKALGQDHPDLAQSLDHLGVLYRTKGDYARAEPMHQRALVIFQKALGLDHPELAGSLHNLAELYEAKGDHAGAEPLMKRALAIWEKALGPEHPSVATSLNLLAELYRAKGDYARAEPLYQRALAIREKALGSDHPAVATSLNNLAELYRANGDHARADPLYRRALSIQEKSLGPEHPAAAGSRNNLGVLYLEKGDFSRAEPLLRRALAIREKTLGAEHPDVARSLRNLASLALARNELTAAIAFEGRASTIEDRNSVRLLATGSDEQRRAYMATLLGTTYHTISLHVQSAPLAYKAKELALTTILRRKGRVIDAMADGFGALRGRLASQDQALFDRWRSLTAQYSALAVRGPGAGPIDPYRKALSDLDDARQEFENKLSFRINEIQTELQLVKLEQVRSAIPEAAALVEFFRYEPFNPKASGRDKTWGKPRYVAYVLFRNGNMTWADLGEAEAIEAAVDELLPALRRVAGDPKAASRKVDSLVMEPIRRLLGETRYVFLSPDGALNLLPFHALMDEDGRYLLERYAFTYLTSGRGLIRMRETAPSRRGPVVIAAPDLGNAREVDGANKTNYSLSAEIAQVSFAPIPFAAEEGRTVARRLSGSTLWMGRSATEGAVKALHGPSLLHIATQSFLLRDQEPARPARNDSRADLEPDRPLLYPENPLVRSGLIFAGANKRQSGNEDGLLTALEASQLDLAGTKLVVVSACDTGAGKVESGEGVYGLRRAFAIAGAETLVISLWNVDDAATRNLMVAYYDGLLAGGGRSEAMRQAQLAMLAERAHPYYWASFIVSGNPAGLDGKPAPPDFAKVPPGTGACACEIGAESPAHTGAWAALTAALLSARRRKRSAGNAKAARFQQR